jgi:hypothetical protein
MTSLLADLLMIGFRARLGVAKLFSSATAAILILPRWTLHRTVRAKDTTIARLGTQQRLTVRAFVEKLARVGWHRFGFSEAANGTHQHGLKKSFHSWTAEG